MIIIKLIMAIALAFGVFISTIYILSRLCFERVNPEDEMKGSEKMETSNLNS